MIIAMQAALKSSRTSHDFWLDDLQKIGADFKENMSKHMQLLDAMNRKQQQVNMRIGENLIIRVKKSLSDFWMVTKRKW